MSNCNHPCAECAAKRTPGTRRRWTNEQKKELLAEARGSSISAVARKYAIAPRILFHWKKAFSG